MLEHLDSCGVSACDTMRAFWDRHGYWTHDILAADPESIPSRARVVAASHHMDRGIDPSGFASGDWMAVLQNRILMAVDKYQAAIARGRKTHREAMELIRRMLAPGYERDGAMNRVLTVLDALGTRAALAAEAA
jgi:hypothetical protein